MEEVRGAALHDINEAVSVEQLEHARIRHTGKKSALTQTMSVMGRLGDQDRRALGATFNAVKQDIERGLEERGDQLRRKELQARLEGERVDVTLPGTPSVAGYRHPLLQSVRDLLGVLRQMGYDVVEGPEVEWEKYNFDMLNIPWHHPARDVQDTFWVSDDIVLRTH